jgi:hypothetical protein
MAATTARPAGLVYLLHFDQLYVPYPGAPRRDCAGHYTGHARGGPRELKRRIGQHGTEKGARLMLAVRNAGITWQLARTWPGGTDREYQLKQQGGASRRCPLCGITPRPSRGLPCNADGCASRSLTSDAEKAAVGLMTAAGLAEHTALRRGLVTGKPARVVARGPVFPDPWAALPPVPIPGENPVTITTRPATMALLQAGI